MRGGLLEVRRNAEKTNIYEEKRIAGAWREYVNHGLFLYPHTK